MSSAGAQSGDDGPPRKRVRKGTKSCWECKRRKVRCQLSSEDVPVCAGCLTRGTTCLSQEFPEERDSSGGGQVGERLGRVEHLLETIIAKMSAYEQQDEAQQIRNDLPTRFSSDIKSKSIALVENAPFLSLFDNSVLGRLDSASQLTTDMATPTSQAGGTRTISCVVPKIDRIRQALLDILPSQKDTDLICSSTSSWMLIHALTSTCDDAINATTFDLIEYRKSSPATIARVLLYLAICLQQLHQDFDARRLQMYPAMDSRMDRYITTVQQLVASDDELLSSLEGLQCLILMGLFHINAGNPRRSWLLFRKAMNIAQLMGYDRKGADNVLGGLQMWHKIIQGERYLCLLFGLPAGCPDPTFTAEENFENPEMDKDELFSRKLCSISGGIIERNQGETTHAYAITQNIDEKLDILARDVGAGWWEVPSKMSNEHTTETSRSFDRAMTQMWYFQLQALLHLPFMLRASTERRYDYSKFSCLKASREFIYRYLILRAAETQSFCCNIVDFGALTASVTLFLGLLDPGTGEGQDSKSRKDADRALIQSVLSTMEELGRVKKDVVAIQSVNVIKALLAFDSSSSSSSSGSGANFKLTIPYFGTIIIARTQQMMTPQSLSADSPAFPSTASNVSSNTPNNPLSQQLHQQQNHQQKQPPISVDYQFPSTSSSEITFTPSFPSHVPFDVQAAAPYVPMSAYQQQGFGAGGGGAGGGGGGGEQGIGGGMGEWDLGMGAGTLFFDGLISTDIEGNWVL